MTNLRSDLKADLACLGEKKAQGDKEREKRKECKDQVTDRRCREEHNVPLTGHQQQRRPRA